MKNKKAVIIVAGGKGVRMTSDIPKQFIQLNGRPVLMHTIEAFYSFDSSIQIVLVLPNAHKDYWLEQCKNLSFDIKHSIVNGGDERFNSVKNGLAAINSETTELIAIHDGVRPFVSHETISNCFEVARKLGAAIPIIDITDSLRKVDNLSSVAVDRNAYKAVQTPQVFRSEILISSYNQNYNPIFTDDASVVEAAGHCIELVEGNRENIKITTPFDFAIAQAIIDA